MSKYSSSLVGPKASQVHSSQYSPRSFSNASQGRVMVEAKKNVGSREMSRPSGRTSYTAGSKTASTDAT